MAGAGAVLLRTSCRVPTAQWSAEARSFTKCAGTEVLSASCQLSRREWRGVSLSLHGKPLRLGRRLPSAPCRCATAEEVEAEKELIEADAFERMEKTLESVKGNFNTVRTGRASPSLLDRVEVEYYGSPVNLRTIAQVSTPDGSTIMITPFDKSSLGSIEKAILKSDIGITPSNDGSVIRLSVPQLTADRRKELLKLVSRLAEDGKVALRNVRRDAIKAYEKLEKDKKLSSDNLKSLTDDIQKLTDEYVKKVDTLMKGKEKELSTV